MLISDQSDSRVIVIRDTESTDWATDTDTQALRHLTHTGHELWPPVLDRFKYLGERERVEPGLGPGPAAGDQLVSSAAAVASPANADQLIRGGCEERGERERL